MSAATDGPAWTYLTADGDRLDASGVDWQREARMGLRGAGAELDRMTWLGVPEQQDDEHGAVSAGEGLEQ
ncbi:hypothetical protein [Jiangella mangrovi]|uniref:Uncharacterized protein n=1 Tax=Jiangella mangrovi TaxID=1524084 RepID=A0A7W9LPU2_9ACTN|nr:hypothetical protein [Jiangella mangrovi]MBB5791788.1 hypothetical protein [Jiangella mangrovi]